MSRSWAGKMRKQLGVVCMKVVVEGKGGGDSTEKSSVHDEKQRTENGAMGTPQQEVCKVEKVPLHLIRKERDNK